MSVSVADIKGQIEYIKDVGKAHLAEEGVVLLPDVDTLQVVNALVEYDTNLEATIDESGVLEENTATLGGKVEQLIDKAEELDIFMNITNAASLFYKTTSFPSKAVVNLPNATTVYQAFAYWDIEPIPIVKELTVNASNINVSNFQHCMGQMFHFNSGVKKVILNMPDESQYMNSTFVGATLLEEIVLNFSTKNIIGYPSAFYNSKALKKIVGVLDFSSATNVTYMFMYCNNLEEVTFAANTLSLSISLAQSSKLSANSIQSIVDGLATVETAQTLTLHKNIVLTDEQKATINSKGWTLAQ